MVIQYRRSISVPEGNGGQRTLNNQIRQTKLSDVIKLNVNFMWGDDRRLGIPANAVANDFGITSFWCGSCKRR